MIECPTLPRATAVRANPSAPRLGDTAAFRLQASITLSFLAGSAAPTALYPVYQAAWGFSAATTTVVFAIYAIAVLAALLVAGRLSDHVGRRPVLLVATLVQAIAMIVLATADGVPALLVGRILQGLSTGAAVAAVGAGLLDLDRARGTVANAIAPILGTASGALFGGLMVHWLPAPTHLVYLLLAAVFVVQGVGVLAMAESIAPKRGALASLRPRIDVPVALRRPMLVAASMLVAVWALAGFYGSLGPALVHAEFGLDSSLFGGAALFLMAGSGASAVLLLRRHDARTSTAAAAVALFAGTALVLVAVRTATPALFFAGTVLGGAGFGAGFQGAIRTVVPFAAPHERAGVLSAVFVVSYLAMGVPAVAAGLAVAHGHALHATAQVFGAVVMGLAAVAFAGTLAARRVQASER